MKRFPWIIVALPVVGVFWFLFFSTPVQKAQDSASVSNQKPEAASSQTHIQKRLFAPDGSRIKSPSAEDIAARKRFDELKKRRDESFKKVAALSTPERRGRIVDGIMQRRDKEYQGLFASWGLSPQQIHDTLAILRAREIQELENRNEFFKDASGKAKAHEVNKLTNRAVSQIELENLLGRSRYAELIATEQRMSEAEFVPPVRK